MIKDGDRVISPKLKAKLIILDAFEQLEFWSTESKDSKSATIEEAKSVQDYLNSILNDLAARLVIWRKDD